MFDPVIRRAFARPLAVAGSWLASRRVGADQVTLVGFGLGLGAAVAIAYGSFMTGLALLLLNRLGDGLDGATARATAQSDRGAFLDIALDFIVYGAIPLAFAVHDPQRNGLSAAILLASFLANGSAFLAFAILAAQRRLVTDRHGPKSIYYLAGMAEGAETIAFFVAFCVVPSAFPVLALVFAAICTVSTVGRLVLGWKALA